MLVILLAIRAFTQHIKNKSLQILTDNISAIAYINYQGGPSKKLTQLAIAIWQDCIENNTLVMAKFLAGRENIHADFLSRAISHHDWMLAPVCLTTDHQYFKAFISMPTNLKLLQSIGREFNTRAAIWMTLGHTVISELRKSLQDMD